MVFLQIPNVPKGTVFAEQVTYVNYYFCSWSLSGIHRKIFWWSHIALAELRTPITPVCLTGFCKTDRSVTLGLFHFIAPANSHNHNIPPMESGNTGLR